MNEPFPPAKIVRIHMNLNGKKINGIIDTGSDKNFITAKIATENNLNTKMMEKPEDVQIADGRCITIKREVNLNFSILHDTSINNKSKFYVIEEQHDDAIVGMQFLKENDAIIDFKNDKITLDNKEYNLNSGKLEICFADSDLMEKSKVLNVGSSESTLNKIIDNYKSKNHKIGDISVKCH
ncbi:Protein DDI1 like protein, partial [Dictyocoela muelleri]